MDRSGLIAAAFLIGSDYDLRGSNPQCSQRDGAGVHGIGVRRALVAARVLCTNDADALCELDGHLKGRSALQEDVILQAGRSCRGCRRCGHGNVSKAQCGKKGCAKCGTKEGCNLREPGRACECDHCQQVLASGGTESFLALRELARVVQRARSEPAILRGFRRTVQQYQRDVIIPPLAVAGFTWQGLADTRVIKESLALGYRKSAEQKLVPLRLEWILRVISAECPVAIQLQPAALREWCVSRGFHWVPLSAKRTGGKSSPLRAVVNWAPVDDNDEKVQECKNLSSSMRRARLSLAEQCRLFIREACTPVALNTAFAKMAKECPAALRKDLTTF